MLPTFIANKFGILFFVFFIAIIGLIIYRTPVLIPVGFPYAAKTIDSDQLIKKKQPLNVIFVDRTLEKGLNFSHQQGDEQLAGIDDSLGSGACAADFNNDGWIDLFLVNGSGHTRYYGQQYWWQSFQGNALFLNESGQGFREATSASGLHKKIWGMGCLTGDFDNDGDADLLVTGKESRLLYKNKGDGTFTDITMESGLTSQFWSTSAAAADFNGDGLLDIYIGNFVDFKKGQKTFEANSQFTGDKKNTFDSSLYAAQPNQLYLNLGGLKFKEIAAQAGVINSDGRTLDVSCQDINGDALPDLLVTNDRGTGSNMAYLNSDGKHFEPGGQALGLRSALGNRGISSGDLDNDGYIDFVLASTPGESTVALIQESAVVGKNTSLAHYKDHAREMGLGGNQFLNLSAWTSIVQDFNNDGFNDVFIAAGQLEPDPDAAKVSQGQPKQLLLNTGSGYFTDVTASAGIALQDMQSARGSVSADFDNDGDVDLYIAHNNDLGQYLVNESPKKHWLGLKLTGTKSNRDGVGAVVQLTTANGKQIRSVVSGEGFLSDGDKRIIFGLGDEDKIDQLIINWPSGRKQTVKSISVDRYWLIEENNNKIDELPVTSAVNAPRQHLRLKLGVEQAEIRARYIRMLGQAEHPEQIFPELIIAAKDNNALIRREVIAVVSRTNTFQGLSILIQGLEDKDTVNVVAAIQGLQHYEDETAIRWLLRLFSHKDPAVKIALADCFGFFFQEEEAVVNRKYLAVPYLVRLLDDTEPKVRISAARALANAERFRGVHSLLDHLNDTDVSIRAEAVRTLGLIRQTKALPQLRQLVSDDIQSAQVIADSFIALKRLGDETVLKTLESFLMGHDIFDTIPVEKRLDVFAHLLDQADDVGLFDAEQLNGLAHRAFDQFSPNTESTAKSTNLTGRWIAIRQHMTDQASIDWLSRQTQSSQESIRASAFQAVLSLKPADRNSILHKALQDEDLSINQWAIEALLHEKNRLSKEDYRKILVNPQFRSIALRSWSKVGFPTELSTLISALNSVFLSQTDTENKHLEHDIHNKSNQGLVVRKIPGKPLNQQLTDLEQLCFSANIELQDFCPMILFSKNTPEHHRVALKLLNNPVYSITIRQAVLKQYGIDFDQDAINTLFTLVQTKKDPLRNSAILKLLSFNENSLLEFANKIAGNVAEDNDVRFQAVEFMTRQGHPEAQEILYR
ncbi:FG-GAP-like repeat-containing protein [Methylobacter sp. S3L5C]|uniref:FG-GAP-like repeat-containing protein n=1 Tax=Methylobacter sp. S3L5C TaxID=2839024 RepID=UPI001FAC8086|nr:FG-GAP-like repeat-containing protein [Methylobacter sp. S3L5C]UOA10635.1 VCBS repeat-containing protein [Methylobacter sp. S3L5C]